MDDKQAQPLIRAKVTNDFVDYPHNDLANAAWFFRERLTKAFESKEHSDGIFVDMMALVTMIAFALEGYANFIGQRVIERQTGKEKAQEVWAVFERKSVVCKIKAIKKMIDIDIDWNKRPYSTIGDLFELRNMFAHPKAHRAKEREKILVGTDGELKQMLRDFKPEYEQRLTWDFANAAYEDIDLIWNGLLKAAEIELHETRSGGLQGIELIEVLNPQDN